MPRRKRRQHTYGISLEPNWPINYCTGLALEAEKLGYSSLWVPDAGPSPPYSDTVVTLAAIAAKTAKIRFGSAVVNFYTRNPAAIASSFLALSDLGSRGRKAESQRAVIGIGVGSPYTVGKFGILERSGFTDEMREAIESIRQLHAGKEVSVRTDAFSIERVSLSKAKTRIPIFVGSNSKKILELSGEIADGVIFTDRIPADIETSLNSVILGIGYGQRSREDLEVVDSVVISLDEDGEKARRTAKVTCAYLVSWLSDEKAETFGIDKNAKAKISKFLEEGDESSAGKLVDRKMVDLLTASGNLEDCLEKCREYLFHDIDEIAFCEPFGPNPLSSIRTIARKLIPRL